MRQQLDRLIDVVRHEHVEMQVLPFTAGTQSDLGGGFTIFDLRAPGRLTVVAVEA